MIGNGWDALLPQEAIASAMQKVSAETGVVYPPRDRIFAAFSLTPPEAVRVVILGQDPYHEPDQAHGLAFSVQNGSALPPSLKNIFKELEADEGVSRARGDLSDWARQGVLLLNTVLTVRQGEANSHRAFGWQAVTDAAVRAIGAFSQPVAFVLWGAQAQQKAQIAAQSRYPRLILKAPHPSPLSSYRGFFGSRPFSKINAFLEENGEKTIIW